MYGHIANDRTNFSFPCDLWLWGNCGPTQELHLRGFGKSAVHLRVMLIIRDGKLSRRTCADVRIVVPLCPGSDFRIGGVLSWWCGDGVELERVALSTI